jgi:hypothetical protein
VSESTITRVSQVSNPVESSRKVTEKTIANQADIFPVYPRRFYFCGATLGLNDEAISPQFSWVYLTLTKS